MISTPKIWQTYFWWRLSIRHLLYHPKPRKERPARSVQTPQIGCFINRENKNTQFTQLRSISILHFSLGRNSVCSISFGGRKIFYPNTEVKMRKITLWIGIDLNEILQNIMQVHMLRSQIFWSKSEVFLLNLGISKYASIWIADNLELFTSPCKKRTMQKGNSFVRFSNITLFERPSTKTGFNSFFIV